MGTLYGGGAQIGAGLSSGLASGMANIIKLKEAEKDRALRERMIGIQEKHYGIQEQQQKQKSLLATDTASMKDYETSAKLALDLWKTGNTDAAIALHNQAATKVGKPLITSWDDHEDGVTFLKAADGTFYAGNKKTGTLTPVGGPIDPKFEFTKRANQVKTDVIAGQDVTPEAQRAAGITVPAEKTVKPEMTSVKAQKRMTELSIAKTKLGKENIVDRILAQSLGLPEGQQMSEEDRKGAVTAIDTEMESLKPYLTTPGAPSAKSASHASQAKTVVRTGNYNGRKVAEYSDGTTGYVD